MASARCPGERDPCEVGREQALRKEYKLTDAERLDKLEKEVTTLRTDFDRLKWEQAVAETAIGRAIIRGSASLGNGAFGLMGQLVKNQLDGPQKATFEKCHMPQLPEKKAITNEKQKQKDECGYFTLG